MRRTRVLAVGDAPEADRSIIEAANYLRAGKLVAFPTETVYGLGADATNSKAVESIFKAKRRPADNPLIVHVADEAQLPAVCHYPDSRAAALIKAFWPGPLTLVLPATDLAKRTVTRGLNTVAVRMPAHPVALALIRQADRPIAAPSANLSGKPSPTSAQHVLEDFEGYIPLILDGGPCDVGIESTVLDLSEEAPLILRPGLITEADIAAVIDIPSHQQSNNQQAKKRSPGTRYRHYSPQAAVFVIGPKISNQSASDLLSGLAATRSGSARIGYIGWRETLLAHQSIAVKKQLPKNAASDLAYHLYRDLRAFDAHSVDAIIIDGVETAGVGISVMDRLRRAATHVFDDNPALQLFLQTKLPDSLFDA